MLNKNMEYPILGAGDYGKVEPYTLLVEEGSRGLKNDIYIPHEGDEGYEEFLKGYLYLEETH